MSDDTTFTQDGLTHRADRCCGQLTRGGHGRRCLLAPGHAGPHASVAFCCDGCDKVRRGRPFGGPRDVDGCLLAAICFVCAAQAARDGEYVPGLSRRRRRRRVS